MKIATWNIERLKHIDKIDEMIGFCKRLDADIFVLTETDSQFKLNHYSYETPKAIEINPDLYKETENRVTVFSKYKIVNTYQTYDKYTATCVELETPRGRLLVYGTIMGIFGNRESSYKSDLVKQVEDIKSLSKIGSLCVVGDYNCSFCDNYYFTNYGRKMLGSLFADTDMSILTANQKECVDHIAVSNGFIMNVNVSITEWNHDKSLSDHKGIMVEL